MWFRFFVWFSVPVLVTSRSVLSLERKRILRLSRLRWLLSEGKYNDCKECAKHSEDCRKQDQVYGRA